MSEPETVSACYREALRERLLGEEWVLGAQIATCEHELHARPIGCPYCKRDERLLVLFHEAVSVFDALNLERDEARYNARVLAHAYKTDNRPPANTVLASLTYPVRPITGKQS